MQTDSSRPVSGKCLDLVLTNMPITISNISTIPGMSDHDAVRFSVNIKPRKAPKPPHKGFFYEKTDVETIQTEIKSLTHELF